MLLSDNLTDGYTGFGVSSALEIKCTSDGSVRRLWYKHPTRRREPSNSSKRAIIPVYGLELSSNPMVRSACGNATGYWIRPSRGWRSWRYLCRNDVVRHLEKATQLRECIVVNTCTAEESIRSVLLSFPFMESLCISCFLPT